MNTSILMMAGGWIESMYLASNLGSDGARPENIIALRVLEQEEVLSKIISSMKMIDDDPLVAEMAVKLEELATLFSAGELKEEKERMPM